MECRTSQEGLFSLSKVVLVERGEMIGSRPGTVAPSERFHYLLSP